MDGSSPLLFPFVMFLQKAIASFGVIWLCQRPRQPPSLIAIIWYGHSPVSLYSHNRGRAWLCPSISLNPTWSAEPLPALSPCSRAIKFSGRLRLGPRLSGCLRNQRLRFTAPLIWYRKYLSRNYMQFQVFISVVELFWAWTPITVESAVGRKNSLTANNQTCVGLHNIVKDQLSNLLWGINEG